MSLQDDQKYVSVMNADNNFCKERLIFLKELGTTVNLLVRGKLTVMSTYCNHFMIIQLAGIVGSQISASKNLSKDNSLIPI